MAGHSKWANIQHRKKAQDNKRGKTFTKVIREITVAAKMGGTDASSNSRLRLALSKATASNVPKDTVKRAIDKASGQNNDNFEEITYEGYGPKGIAVIVECLTDNKNRTVSDLRHVLSKHGGSLGTNGSVSHLFRKVGIMKLNDITEDDLIEHMEDIQKQQKSPLRGITPRMFQILSKHSQLTKALTDYTGLALSSRRNTSTNLYGYR